MPERPEGSRREGKVPLTVSWEEGGSVRISCDGVLDRDTVPDLSRRLFRDVLKKRPRHLRLDLSAVERMDTAGLAFVLELRNALKSQGAGFRLEGVTDSIRRLVALARLENLLFENS